jgi:hypothetical protein
MPETTKPPLMTRRQIAAYLRANDVGVSQQRSISMPVIEVVPLSAQPDHQRLSVGG